MTSIEWLINQIEEKTKNGGFCSLNYMKEHYFEQAKDLHKQELKDVYDHAFDIKLPNNEDIDNMIFRYCISDFGQMSAFKTGAKYVIDKIKNQINQS